MIPHAGRYAREAVLLAFEMIGGVERMASWANDHPTEFYTRLYTKVITREVEIGASEGIEELLMRLDGDSPALSPETEVVEGEYTVETEPETKP